MAEAIKCWTKGTGNSETSDEGEIKIGVMGIDPEAEDWFFRPATIAQILTVTN